MPTETVTRAVVMMLAGISMQNVQQNGMTLRATSMIIETLLVCLTVYFLLSPIVFAKVDEIQERVHRLELENNNLSDNQDK
jgi:hypothetical protein